MSKLSDFTEAHIESLYPNFVRSQGITTFEQGDFTCLEFQVIVEETVMMTTNRGGLSSLINFFGGSRKAERRSYKRYFYETKFFEKQTGLYLGSSKGEAATAAGMLANDEFVRENFKEALRLFNIAYKNAVEDSQEAKKYKELLDITEAVVMAEADLVERRASIRASGMNFGM